MVLMGLEISQIHQFLFLLLLFEHCLLFLNSTFVLTKYFRYFIFLIIFTSYFEGGYLHVPVAPRAPWADEYKVLVFFPVFSLQSILYVLYAWQVLAKSSD